MNNLFMDTKTTQYGSHMVMTGSRKPTRSVYVNIDTKFRDATNSSTLADYTITLPERLNSVHSMEVISAEIPYTVYNISSAIGNNVFYLSYETNDTTNIKTVQIADGEYSTPASIVTAINSSIQTLDSSYNTFALSTEAVAGGSSYVCVLDNSAGAHSLHINFGNIAHAPHERAALRGRLGWKLGFRDLNYVVSAAQTVSGEAFIDVSPPKYLFLVVDDFAKGANNSFIAPFYKGIMNKNIIARIPIPTDQYSFGQTIYANTIKGTMVSDIRTYSGTGADLQRLKVQLVDEFGSVVDLNEMDFSFMLRLDVE